MAVYTELTPDVLERIADAYGLGPVRESIGIPQGSINTNYRLETGAGRVFLRHTTVRSPEDLAFEASLLSHLEQASVPAPRLRRTLSGKPFIEAEGGRVSIFAWLAGEERQRPELTERALSQLGHTLARFHVASTSFEGTRANPYGADTVRGWLEALVDHPQAELGTIARELLADLAELTPRAGRLEPRGVIHADLFLDNVKWVGERVSALFDFEMACVDAFGLDLAITLNAWCFEDGRYRWEHVQAFLRGYEEVRPLEPVERERLRSHAWFGAIRYCVSRIRDFHLSDLPPERLFRKDFRTYLARARTLREMTDGAFLANAQTRR